MGIASFASRRTRAAFTATGAGGEMTVAGGESVQVCGILFNAGSANVVFTVTNNGTTVLFTVEVSANTALETSVPWLADDGLRIQVDTVIGTDPSVVVFHNSPGT